MSSYPHLVDNCMKADVVHLKGISIFSSFRFRTFLIFNVAKTVPLCKVSTFNFFFFINNGSHESLYVMGLSLVMKPENYRITKLFSAFSSSLFWFSKPQLYFFRFTLANLIALFMAAAGSSKNQQRPMTELKDSECWTIHHVVRNMITNVAPYLQDEQVTVCEQVRQK